MREPDAELKDIVIGSISGLKKLFPKAEHLSELILLLEKAILLSSENIDDIDAIHELGQGWVAEETLAIAVYCSLKHIDSFEAAIIASVNHSGDSDSTGAVTGNILGSYLGIDAISSEFQEPLELYELMTDLADKLITMEPLIKSFHDTLSNESSSVGNDGFAIDQRFHRDPVT